MKGFWASSRVPKNWKDFDRGEASWLAAQEVIEKSPFKSNHFGLRIIGLRLNLLVTVEKSKGLFDDDRRSFCYFSISRK